MFCAGSLSFSSRMELWSPSVVTGSQTRPFLAAFLKPYCGPGKRSDKLCALESLTQLASWGTLTKTVLDI